MIGNAQIFALMPSMPFKGAASLFRGSFPCAQTFVMHAAKSVIHTTIGIARIVQKRVFGAQSRAGRLYDERGMLLERGILFLLNKKVQRDGTLRRRTCFENIDLVIGLFGSNGSNF